MEARKIREKKFHDVAFSGRTREKVDKFYSVFGRTLAFYEDYLAARCKGKRVLEYGCGPGSHTFFLAEREACVTGIDISEVAIQQASEEAQIRGLYEVNYKVMDAESLAFEDSSFDIVCGSGILHHLDLKRAFTELARTLVPEGVGIFIEPLGHNPLTNLYRRLTPKMRTEDEHPLLMPDLEMAKQYFTKVETHYFHLSTLLAVPFRERPGFERLLSGLEVLDGMLFRFLPATGRLAWIVVLVLTEPRKSRPAMVV
jgi:SAM-dependent methyltransferase